MAITTTATWPSITVPSEMDFGEQQFLVDETLQQIGNALIAQYPDILGHLAGIDIAYFWKVKGGKSGGNAVLGKAVKPSGLMKAFTNADAVVHLSADHVAEAMFSDRQITALVFHELRHFEIKQPKEDDKDGEPKLLVRGHDVELFADEVRIFGNWHAMLTAASEAFKQAGLGL